MKTTRILLVTFIRTMMLCSTPFGHSYNPNTRCSTKEYTEEQRKKSGEVLTKWLPKLQQLGLHDGVMKSIEIPTYFHIVRADDGSGNITYKNVKKQVNLMNKSYRPYFKFVLKKVTRTDNTEWQTGMDYYTDQEIEMTNALHIGGRNSLNIYVVESLPDDSWGYAYFPDNYDPDYPKLDYSLITGYSMPLTPYDETILGMTSVHEAGHWLGLYHTFEGGCRGVGDVIDDTPPQKSASFGCPIGRNSCKGGKKDPIHNFMDYADDTCVNEFTSGQVNRMLSQWHEYRCNNSKTWRLFAKGKKKRTCSWVGGNPNKRCKKVGKDEPKQKGKVPASISCCKACS